MKNRELTCSVEGDELVVRIGLDTLKFAAEHGPFEEWVGEDYIPVYLVEDAQEFAIDVANELSREDEVGNSMLRKLLDTAMLEAANNGSQGLSDKVDENA